MQSKSDVSHLPLWLLTVQDTLVSTAIILCPTKFSFWFSNSRACLFLCFMEHYVTDMNELRVPEWSSDSMEAQCLHYIRTHPDGAK